MHPSLPTQRPVAKAAEIVGDRWTLLLVRELLFGPLGFNEPRSLPKSQPVG
jgi:DNA-binding HxlR family transcriptional regulator